VTFCSGGFCVGNLCGVAGSTGTTNGTYDGTCAAAGSADGTCYPADGASGAAASNGICFQGGNIANGSAPCSANVACGARDECAPGWFCNYAGSTFLTTVEVGTCVQLCNPTTLTGCAGGTTCTAQSSDIGVCVAGSSSSSSSSGGSSSGSSSSSSSGGSSGASGGLPGDTCSSCTTATCSGATDDCVCDPSDAACSNGYCAPDCYDASTGAGNQAACTGGTQCLEVSDDSASGTGDDGSGDDWVCYPASQTCISG
jgi:hypothetical protein